MGKILHEELSGAIIGIAMEVLNELRPGLDEVLYERAMVIELRRRGHTVEVQHSFPVFYRGELIGTLVPDLIVDSAIIVDPKVVKAFTETHVAQMLGYLNITGLELALLLNFKNARLGGSKIATGSADSVGKYDRGLRGYRLYRNNKNGIGFDCLPHPSHP